ncbi:uncharacterized protein LOC144377656 [Ictidomys tridecemlineatus]
MADINQRRCQATGKLLSSAHPGQLGARIPSLPVRCHKPFIGCTVANLKNKSIKARRPPTYPEPKTGFKETGVFSATEAPGTGPHVGAGNSSARATSPLRGSDLPAWPGPPPGPHPRAAKSLVFRERRGSLQGRLGQVPRPSPPALGRRRERAANSPGRSGARGRGGAAALQRSRQTFAGAQRASLGGPAKDARARRGEPGAAGGGGRPRARAAGARGSRRGMGPAASAWRAARPPAGPAALPAPSRLPLASAAARRAGARRAARNCFHCKQKKATHDQAGGGEARGGRRAEGRDGAEGAEGAGERENVGRAAGGLGRWARTHRGGPSRPPAPWPVLGPAPHSATSAVRASARLGCTDSSSASPLDGAGRRGLGDQGQLRPWTAGQVGRAARGLSPPLARAARAGRRCTAGNVSPERSYPIRMPYKARK